MDALTKPIQELLTTAALSKPASELLSVLSQVLDAKREILAGLERIRAKHVIRGRCELCR